jgi:hypothetical protein
MKTTVFWVAAPCSLGEVYDVSEVLAASISSLDDGSSKHLLNVCKLIPVYEA